MHEKCIIPYLDTVVKRGMCGYFGNKAQAGQGPQQCKGTGDPKDLFKFFKNPTTRPIRSQLKATGADEKVSVQEGKELVVTNGTLTAKVGSLRKFTKIEFFPVE